MSQSNICLLALCSLTYFAAVNSFDAITHSNLGVKIGCMLSNPRPHEKYTAYFVGMDEDSPQQDDICSISEPIARYPNSYYSADVPFGTNFGCSDNWNPPEPYFFVITNCGLKQDEWKRCRFPPENATSYHRDHFFDEQMPSDRRGLQVYLKLQYENLNLNSCPHFEFSLSKVAQTFHPDHTSRTVSYKPELYVKNWSANLKKMFY